MIFLGIDPGKHGALAALAVDGAGKVLEADVWDALITENGELDLNGTANVLEMYDQADTVATIERVNSFVGEGHMGAFRFGANYGMWLGLLSGVGIPYERVLPKAWQRLVLPPRDICDPKRSGRRRDKTASIELARRLFPSADLRLKKHDGRAEALLIAEYGRRKYRFESSQAGRWNAVHG